jgi:acetyl coenzyme A synthetase (ADP forming)-like protein
MPSTPAAVDVVLRDGSTVCLRRPTEADVTAVLDLLNGLSPRSRYFRFLGYPALTLEKVRPLVVTPPASGRALLAESGGRIVGFAGYQRDQAQGRQAEVAFAIADAVQGNGIGTRLLEQLARMARADGIDGFDAYVLGGNRRMLDVFRDSGFATTMTIEHGVYRIVVSLDVTPGFEEKAAARSRRAATESMRAFFEPKVVAVVGANRERGRIGSEILHNLLDAGFTGTIVPVHPSVAEIAGLPAVPRVTDVPGDVDLAIVVVPARQVLSVVDDCIAKRVRAICVISAGFGECDADGRTREAALVERVRTAGCRLIGPNCMGLLNTAAGVRLNATFSPVYPPAGNVAMSTQSGALGLAILDYARRLGIGISSFVSVGNKADVSSNDLIQYWADDPNTDVILLYLESFGNPKKFSEIARRVGRSKPIVAVKAGRSAAGSRAAASHTGALASSDTAIDALFRQAGVIRTERLEELFDVAALLARQPLPAGRRVAILTNAGGPGILAADACEANGLELPPLSTGTQNDLRAFLPAAAAVGNPVDMLASAPPDDYRRALTALLRDENVDSVITIFIPPLVTQPDAVATAIAEASRGATKPVLGVFMRAEGAPASLAPIPSYAFPESAALALASAAAYAEWRRTPPSSAPVLDQIDPARVRRVRDGVLARGGGWTTPDENLQLLSAVGIAAPPAHVVKTVDEALTAADRVGYPVAIKALGPSLLHKTERRAVRLQLENETTLRAAFTDFAQRFGSDMTSVLVQQMVPAGVEMLVGVVQDPLFGPLIACGTGGTMVDVLQDTQFRLHPLTTADAAGMLNALKGIRLLRGFRGSAPADEGALRDVLLRVSTLLTLAPEIQELDINPVIVLASGAWAADVRLRIASSSVERSGRRVEY